MADDDVKAAAERLLDATVLDDYSLVNIVLVARGYLAVVERVERLEAALIPMLDEFGARLSDGKPLGYTVGSMERALRMIREASAALDPEPTV